MASHPTGKISQSVLIAAIGSVYSACAEIKQNANNAISPDQKKAFFSFVESWLPWANTALEANASSFKETLYFSSGIDKQKFSAALSDYNKDNSTSISIVLTDDDVKSLRVKGKSMVKPAGDSGYILKNDNGTLKMYSSEKLDFEALLNVISRARLFQSNVASVLRTYDGYPGGAPLTQTQVDLFANFLTKMADKSVVNYFQCTRLVDGMMKVLSGKRSDNWKFTFPNNEAAEFENILKNELPPGFEARNMIIGANYVSFSLAQEPITNEKISAFLEPVSASPAGKVASKKAPKRKVQDDGVIQMPTFVKISPSSESSSAGYTDDKTAALSATYDQPSSYMEKTMQMQVSAAVYYGEKYESDKYLSAGIGEEQAKLLIFDLATSFGHSIQPPPATLEQWLADPDKGQEFLKTLKKAGIKLNVTGSADMAVFYDGKNESVVIPAAKKNKGLGLQRSDLVINPLKKLNDEIIKKGGVGFDFDYKPKAKLHFFQDFTQEEAKRLNLSEYGYKQGEGEGAANMTALMTYLKTLKDAKSIAPEGASPIYSFKVGETTRKFTQKDKDDATKYYDKLLSSGAVVQDGEMYKAGKVELLNKYFRRMDGDPSLHGAPGASEGMIFEGKVPKDEKDISIPPNVFSRAMTESTEVSHRSVSFVYEAKVHLGISVEVAKEGDKDVVKATADYKINGVPVQFNDRNGTIEPPETVGNRTIAVAYTKDKSINSGYVWQTVPEKVKKPTPGPDPIPSMVPLPKSIRTPISSFTPGYFGTTNMLWPFSLAQSSNTDIVPALNKAYRSIGAEYLLGPGYWKIPETLSDKQYSTFVSTLIFELDHDQNFSRWAKPGVTGQDVVKALMASDKEKLRELVTPAAYNAMGQLLEGKVQKVRIEDASRLAGAQVVAEVTISKAIALRKQQRLGEAFVKSFAGGANPLKIDGMPDLSWMKDGDQNQFTVHGKKYTAICQKQANGDVVSLSRTPNPVSIVVGLNNRSLMVYDKIVNATSVNAMIVGTIQIKKFGISPYIGGGFSMPTGKGISGEGQDFYLNYPLMGGVSTRVALSKTLAAGLDFGIQHILSKETSPYKVGQVSLSFEKKIPGNANFVVNFNMGENFYETTSPTYFAGAGVGVGKRSQFIVGAKYEVSDPLKNIKEGLPTVYIKFNMFPKGTE